MEITDNFSGRVAIIAAGTGILPFIDLLDLLYKKTIYQALSLAGKDTSVVKPEQNYDKLFSGSKFKLLCAFRSLEDFVGWEWIDQMAQVSKDKELNNFECVVRLKDNKAFEGVRKVSNRFDAKFLKKELSEGFDKIWLCATPEMHEILYQALVKIGINENKIVFV